jgi:hypothetical protein
MERKQRGPNKSNAAWKTNHAAFKEGIKRGIFDITIDSVGFTSRTVKVLRDNDIMSVENLIMNLPPKDRILKWRNCSEITASEIQKVRNKIKFIISEI